MILIDALEPESIRTDLTTHWKQAKVAPLEAGDIMLIEAGKTMLIERKAAPDLMNSIGNGHLVDQCSRMIDLCDFPVVLCHGDLKCDKQGKVVADGRSTMWGWWSLHMELLSLQAGGIIYLHVRKGDLIEAIEYLQGWLRKGEHLRVERREPLPFLIDRTQANPLRILASLPGVGAKKAEDCLRFYSSAAWALSDLTDVTEHNWPAGIGRGTVDKIREALGLEEGIKLDVVIEEGLDIT